MSLISIAEKMNLFVLKLKKKKIYYLNKGEIGINLGSEDNTIKEYVGVDGSLLLYLSKSFIPSPAKKFIYQRTCTSNHRPYKSFYQNIIAKRIIHHNLEYGVPFKSNSVPYVYTSHFIEHLTEKEAEFIVGECYRCLKNRGIIRIVVPDLDKEIERIESSIEQSRGGNNQPIQEFLTCDRNNHNKFSFHQKIYNFNELKKVLEKAGFKEIKRQEFKEGELPLVNRLDTRKGLIVEAFK